MNVYITALCNIDNCFVIVHGNWSPWQYGQCTKTCGSGIIRRKRTCNNPPPSINGSDCNGPAYGILPCYSKACPGMYTLSEFIFLPRPFPCKHNFLVHFYGRI